MDSVIGMGCIVEFLTASGVTALSAAAIEDAISWGFLALVTATVTSGNMLNVVYILMCLLAFALFILVPTRWGFMKLMKISPEVEHAFGNSFEDRGKGDPGEFIVWVSLLLCIASAWFTSFIGVHAIFGAFLSGLCVPREHNLPKKLIAKIEDLVSILLLPLVCIVVVSTYLFISTSHFQG